MVQIPTAPEYQGSCGDIVHVPVSVGEQEIGHDLIIHEPVEIRFLHAKRKAHFLQREKV